MTSGTRQFSILAALILLAAFLAIYLPDIGHGFQSDDFRWIRESRLESPLDVVRLFQTNVGFYRPLVALSFGLDFSLWDSHALGYGVTNLLFLLIDGALLFALARRLGLPTAAAVVTSAVWLLNFHAVNMALLWLSGRTALLAGLFGLAAAHCLLDRRRVWAAAFALLAMLCKEEAIALAPLFAAWEWHEGGSRRPSTIAIAVARTGPAWLAVATYAVLRVQSGAFGPTDAPSYYRFTVAPVDLGRNLFEYLDRGATLAIAITVVLIAAGRGIGSLEPSERRAIRFGALWFVAWYLITIFLPVRSSLYALIPSAGSALAAGAVAAAAMRRNPRRFAQVSGVLVLIAMAAVPIYRNRNTRWVEPAKLSSRVLATLRTASAPFPEGGTLHLIDDPTSRFNLQSAFGSLFPDAVATWIGPRWTGEIVTSAPPSLPRARGAATLLLRLQQGALVTMRIEPPLP